MSKLEDIRAAAVKAGVPTALTIPTKRTHRGGKHPKTTPEKPANNEEALTKAHLELKDARSKRIDLEGRLRKALANLKDEKEEVARLKRLNDQTEEVLAKLRKAIGAGKDSKAKDLPGRVSVLMVKLGEIEAEWSAAKGREILLQQQLEVLQQEVEAKSAEISRLRAEAEPIILEGGTAQTLEARTKSVGPEVATLTQSEGNWSQVDEVVPTFFTSFVSTEAIEAVKERYCNWVIGRGPYARARSNRVDQGVNPSWTLGDLIGAPPVQLEGTAGTSVDIRGTDGGWVLRFVHPDWQFEGTAWWNIARISKHHEGVQVEHALIRLTGAHAQRPSTNSVPNVLKDLFSTVGNPYPWEDFRGLHKTINSDNIQIFVEGVLLNDERNLPVVVVSPCRQSKEFLIRPEELAKSLVGLAVVFVADPDDPFLLTNELELHGFERRAFSCWDGAVRMYLPGLSKAGDPYRHALWPRPYLEKKSPIDRAKLITRRVAAHSVGLRVPQGFGRLIEDHDLKVVTENSSRMGVSGEAADQIRAFRDQVKALNEALERTRNEAHQLPALRKANLDLQEDVNLLLEYDRQSKDELKQLRVELEESGKRLHTLRVQKELAQEMAREAVSTTGSFRKELIDGILRKDWSPICAYLRLLQARYPDRLVVLDRAWETAEDCEIEFREKAEALLYTLVTDYYLAKMDNGDDEAIAHRVFPRDSYAPNEGDFLSPQGIKSRTFEYEGREVCMLEHLKITKAKERYTSRKVFRTHFYWDGQGKKIVIGHVGRHLPP